MCVSLGSFQVASTDFIRFLGLQGEEMEELIMFPQASSVKDFEQQ